MSYYTGIKLELTDLAYKRLIDYYKRTDSDNIELYSPSRVYSVTKDGEHRFITYVCQNHAPYSCDIENMLVRELKVDTKEFNIQTWGEDRGYRFDNNIQDWVKQDGVKAEEYGNLEAWVQLTDCEDDEIDSMVPKELEWVIVRPNYTMSDEELIQYNVDKEKDFKREILLEIREELNEMKYAIEDLTKTLADFVNDWNKNNIQN